MCGFAGFVGKNINLEEKRKILKNMTDVIIHRGPDSEGHYVDDDVALGFRRLSIIDLSECGNQPFFNEDRTKILVFNGEIYNYQELRKELVDFGHIFISHTDSETILHGYEQWGTDLIYRLRGMFAFAIWDTVKQELFFARDMFGIKPLYYANMNKTFMFGSEIKSFFENPSFKREFNSNLLGYYLTYQFVPTSESFFKGVFSLNPGHYGLLKNGKLSINRYFEPDFSGCSNKTLEDTVDDIEKVMKDSVAHHKISDVEVASYLSSGVDSSYLASLGEVDHTYTVGFSQKEYSEISYAKDFAKSINVENKEKVISPDEYWDKLSDIQYFMDEPVADPAAIALYFLSKEARKDVKVVLSGEGSDELFGGYNIYKEPLEHTGFNVIPKFIRKGLGKLAENCLPVGTKGRGFLIRHGKCIEERYYSNANNVFSDKEANKVLKNGFNSKACSVVKPLYEKTKGQNPVSRMQYIDMHIWLAHDILVKGDKMGMANSIEVRVPFLDKEVYNIASKLPLDYKVAPPRTKVALRDAAFRRISKKVAEKKKLGFPIPIRVWLKNEKYYNKVMEAFTSKEAKEFFDVDYLVKMLQDHKNDVNKNKLTDNSRRIWTIYIFLIWYKRFFVCDKPVHPWAEAK